MKTNIFDRCKATADEKITIMRNVASNLFKDREDIIIGVNGSVARREYTSGSDIDYFFLSTKEEGIGVSEDEKKFRIALCNQGLKMPSSGGVFEGAIPIERLLNPIGGNNDKNKTLTRRMLFLLEGEWIFNENAFDELRENLIEKYVSDDLECDKLALYLLNDIIRYWRTICVDFEYKTSNNEKPRAIRLAKLRFSRMLLCFAGFIAIAEANNLNVHDKREKLVKMFSLQSIERLDHLLESKFAKAKKCYGTFLSELDNGDFRSKLELIGREGLETDEHKKMTELARCFKNELVDILLTNYGTDKQIIRAILL